MILALKYLDIKHKVIWKCVLKLCPSIWRKEKVYNGFLIWFLKYAKYLTLGKKKSQINLFEALKNTLTHVESLFTCAFELNFVIFLFFEKSKKPFKTFVWFAYYIYIYIYIFPPICLEEKEDLNKINYMEAIWANEKKKNQ